MRGPASVWFAVRAYEPPGFAHTSRNNADLAADRVARTGEFRPDVVRYDLADPERDAREAAALGRLLSGAPIFEADRATIASLRDRLKGGAR